MSRHRDEPSTLPRPDRPRALLAVAALLATATAGYTVERGETLSGIAARHGTTTSALASLNGIDDIDRILAGQRLHVHTAAGSNTPTAPASAASQSPAPAATRADVGALLDATARQYGWSPDFVKALAWQESGWRNDVVSSAGAVGIMQVLPSTGRFVSAQLAGRPLDLHDPGDNVLAGVLFLDYLHGLTDGDPERILAGYYQGLASVRRNGMYTDTRSYIDNVQALRARFR